eukprot:2900074-Prymnesium_polylepis.3
MPPGTAVRSQGEQDDRATQPEPAAAHLADDAWFGDDQADQLSGILIRQRLTNMIPPPSDGVYLDDWASCSTALLHRIRPILKSGGGWRYRASPGHRTYEIPWSEIARPCHPPGGAPSRGAHAAGERGGPSRADCVAQRARAAHRMPRRKRHGGDRAAT